MSKVAKDRGRGGEGEGGKPVHVATIPKQMLGRGTVHVPHGSPECMRVYNVNCYSMQAEKPMVTSAFLSTEMSRPMRDSRFKQ